MHTFTKQDLIKMQSWPLTKKVRVTQTRIMDWGLHWGEDQIYIAWSGGLDSTILLDLARRIYPNIPAVFVDTGLEYPEVREFVKIYRDTLMYFSKEGDTIRKIARRFHKTAAKIWRHPFNQGREVFKKYGRNRELPVGTRVSIPYKGAGNVVILRPEMSFKQVLEKYGYPVISKKQAANIRKLRHGNLSDRYKNYILNGDERGNSGMLSKKWQFLVDGDVEISEYCCDVMKKRPLHKYTKATGRKTISGILAEESKMREQKFLQTGCNAFDLKEPMSKPMSFWLHQNILQYVLLTEMPYPTVYGEIVPVEAELTLWENDEDPTLTTTGVERTGCMFCMFGVDQEKEPNRFQQMAVTHPNQYKYCIEGGAWDENGLWKPSKKGLGCGRVMDILGVSYS